MKPVDMTVMHNPPTTWGDCWRCCIASILELPPEDVPHFSALAANDGDERTLLREWLAPRGLWYFDVNFPAENIPNWSKELSFHHIVSGVSPRGTRHACVGFGAEVVHDPHPSRGGVKPDEDGTLMIGILCRL